jgi:hypothetical protein
VEHLEGNQALVTKIPREVHGRHATPAELALDLVAANQGGV